MTITQSKLQELFFYDPSTGVFTRRVTTSGRSKAGADVSCKTAAGYVEAMIAGKVVLMHRMAFLYMTGALPVGQVDHINGVRHDNRWCNLRAVEQSTNMQNLKKATVSNTSTGLLGSFKSGQSKTNPYKAMIRIGGKNTHLGRFPTAEAAHDAYVAAKRIHHPGCTL